MLVEQPLSIDNDMLGEFDLDCEIYHASYFDLHVVADYYFVYCWPGKMIQVQEHFESVAPAHARLLICHGAKDIRRKAKFGTECFVRP